MVVDMGGGTVVWLELALVKLLVKLPADMQEQDLITYKIKELHPLAVEEACVGSGMSLIASCK